MTRNISPSFAAGSPLSYGHCEARLGILPERRRQLGIRPTRETEDDQRGLRTRNSLIYTAVKRRGIPMVVTMGGGYPKSLDPDSEAFTSVIGAHADVYKQIVEYYG